VSALVVAPTATSPGRCEALFKAKYSNTSWLLSADYKITRDALVYAKVSTGYRAGSHQTNGNSNPASFTPADPEKALQYEVGVKATFLDGRARINAAAFYTDYKDIIRSIIAVVPNTTPLQTTSVFQTAAKATIKGGEVEATFIPVDGLTLTSSVGYVHGKYDSYPEANLDRRDQPFSIGAGAIPRWTYSLGARYEHPTDFGRWTASATYSYRGKTFAFAQPLTPNPAPGAPIVVARADLAERFGGFEDLSGRLSLDVDAWDATFAVYGANLTDKRVCLPNTDLVAFGFRNCAAQAPRTYGVAVAKRF
jgi:iron complex outermembrane receptor protein